MNTELERDKRREAAEYIRTHLGSNLPSTAVIIGSGLDAIAESMHIKAELHYADIPNFPSRPTIASHLGNLAIADYGGEKILLLRGRYHYYEGYSLREATFPIRVLQELGVRHLVLTGASGSLAPFIRKGDIALIADHINLIGDNPLIGPNDAALGERFPDMSEPYSIEFRHLAKKSALLQGIHLHEAVYCAVAGPQFGTAAEYRWYRSLDADLVGMSIVPETIVARHAGMNVLALCAVTDECYPDTLEPISYKEIIAEAEKTAPTLQKLLLGIVPHLK